VKTISSQCAVCKQPINPKDYLRTSGKSFCSEICCKKFLDNVNASKSPEVKDELKKISCDIESEIAKSKMAESHLTKSDEVEC
jgi:recombinational DNA repair protein (RecF pathway)